MPTVGWIQESASDRYSDSVPYKKEPPQPILCKLCGRSFFDLKVLNTHLGIDHPLKQPVMRIGREAGTQFEVRDREALASMSLIHTETCTLIEGAGAPQNIHPEAVLDRLKKARNTQYRLLLSNTRQLDGRKVEVEVLIKVAIPDPQLCAKVDQLFNTILAVERPTAEAVTRFLSHAPTEPAVREYAGALADYVLGILIKEQDRSAGTIMEFPAFKAKFSSARHVLNHFHNPLTATCTAT
jgi:hypothetical protein